MRLDDALDIINEKIINEKVEQGFMVHFEWVDGALLRSDYFPDRHEGDDLIETEEEAWKLAEEFAERTKGKCVDIYVIDHKHVPVKGYEKRKIKNR